MNFIIDLEANYRVKNFFSALTGDLENIWTICQELNLFNIFFTVLQYIAMYVWSQNLQIKNIDKNSITISIRLT
mgnify:CR=1 FL=1